MWHAYLLLQQEAGHLLSAAVSAEPREQQQQQQAVLSSTAGPQPVPGDSILVSVPMNGASVDAQLDGLPRKGGLENPEATAITPAAAAAAAAAAGDHSTKGLCPSADVAAACEPASSSGIHSSASASEGSSGSSVPPAAGVRWAHTHA